MGTVVMLTGVRGAFLELGEPDYYQSKKQNDKDERRWDAVGLIPYKSPLLAVVNKAIEEVAQNRWEKKWEMVLENLRGDPKAFCFQDGKKKDYDGYPGHWALTAHRKESKGRPLVIDSDKSPIYDPLTNQVYKGKAGRVYSGCYINLQVELFAWDNKTNGSKGIGATLLVIQRVRDGDAFSGGVTPNTEAFDEITEGADADDLT